MLMPRAVVLLALVALVVLIALATHTCGASSDAGTEVVPLRVRVAQLEKRQAKLEAQLVALRALVCLQLPTC